MPRPESPEGPWVTIPVRVRESLLARIDAARGDRNRSEWGRAAMEAAVGSDVPVSRPEPVNGAPEPAAKSPERPAERPRAAVKTVTPAPAGVPAAAFQEPAGVPLDPTGQPCVHPKGRRSKGLCGACGTYVGAA